MEKRYKKLGMKIPEIMLPASGTDLTKWAVIACDQYTSQPGYWNKVNEEVGDSPSTLRLTFPEIYLKEDDRDSRINNINEAMAQYMRNGILEPQTPGFVLVDRKTPHAASRKGLIVALDLEYYDYRAGSQTLIRATEGTVLDRIPPRVKIRENAPIETPHIMVLIDDPGKTVIEPLFEKVQRSGGNVYMKLYDFELMQGGGHIKGWKVEDEESLAGITEALDKLADPEEFLKKYAISSPMGADESGQESSQKGVLLFAMGDGNHSLASAKAHWENVKATLQAEGCSTADANTAAASEHSDTSPVPDHPARYALVELVNVHDEGLAFEPIHRVLFGIDGKTVLEQLKNTCSNPQQVEYGFFDSKEELKNAMQNSNKCRHHIPFILEGRYGLLTIKDPACSLEAGTLQNMLDKLGKVNDRMEIDYIHGNQVVTEIGSKKGCMGFYLPVMNKHDLFKTVILDGVLPKKTFSMGEAEEKRYYLECRRIR